MCLHPPSVAVAPGPVGHPCPPSHKAGRLQGAPSRSLCCVQCHRESLCPGHPGSLTPCSRPACVLTWPSLVSSHMDAGLRVHLGSQGRRPTPLVLRPSADDIAHGSQLSGVTTSPSTVLPSGPPAPSPCGVGAEPRLGDRGLGLTVGGGFTPGRALAWPRWSQPHPRGPTCLPTLSRALPM